ncbi:MAG: helix-hairpin-helix domain-containing protein, partial [Gammaproteobacteria bacterium]
LLVHRLTYIDSYGLHTYKVMYIIPGINLHQCRTIDKRLRRRGYRPKGKAALQRYILQGLPGIGAKRAADLLAHFSTVEEVFTADEEALSAVPGIDLDTARKIRQAVGEKAAGYRIGFQSVTGG